MYVLQFSFSLGILWLTWLQGKIALFLWQFSDKQSSSCVCYTEIETTEAVKKAFAFPLWCLNASASMTPDLLLLNCKSRGFTPVPFDYNGRVLKPRTTLLFVHRLSCKYFTAFGLCTSPINRIDTKWNILLSSQY